ncbi:MAG: fibronectin type III domain-containing protein [Candidatus Oxydemutatoraceae bacterium WSBS_2016_MAG_OTU14]
MSSLGSTIMESSETHITVIPDALLPEGFALTSGTDGIEIVWDESDEDFLDKTGGSIPEVAFLSIALDNLDTGARVSEIDLNINARNYINNNLMPGTRYNARIAIRIQLMGQTVSTRGKELNIPFTTLGDSPAAPRQFKNLPIPQPAIFWTTGAITVLWNNVPESVLEYSLSLEGAGSPYATPQSLDPHAQESIIFDSLTGGSVYTLMLVAKGDQTAYRDSNAFTQNITPDGISAPTMVTAVTENHRTEVIVSWAFNPFVDFYRVRLHRGDNTDSADVSDGQGLVTYLFGSSDNASQQEVSISAWVGETSSPVTRVPVTPDALLPESFTLTNRINEIELAWNERDEDFLNKTGRIISGEGLLIAFDNLDTGNRGSEINLNINARNYINNSLMPGTRYNARIAIRTRRAGEAVSARGKELNIPFTTQGYSPPPPIQPEALPTPQPEVSWTRDTITVNWNSAPESVMAYSLSLLLEGDGASPAPQSVAPQMQQSVTFRNLPALRDYTLTLIARGDQIAYRDSSPFNIRIQTGQTFLAPISPPTVMAVTENDRTAIRVSWIVDPLIREYKAELYEGIEETFNSNMVLVSIRKVPLSQSDGVVVFPSAFVASDKNYTVSVSEFQAGSSTIFPKVFATAIPGALRSSSFSLRRDAHGVELAWNKSHEDFLDKTGGSDPAITSLLIALDNLDTGERGLEENLNINDRRYINNDLTPGTRYNARIAIRRIQLPDSQVPITGKELMIPFRTQDFYIFPIPLREHFTLTALSDEITINWANSTNAGVRMYEIELEGAGASQMTTVDASMSGSTIFKSLVAETTYTVSIYASNNRSVFERSIPLRIEEATPEVPPEVITPEVPPEVTPEGIQLGIPDISLRLENGVDLIVNWFPIDSAEQYVVNLYRGADTSSNLDSSTSTTSTIQRFNDLEVEELYTVEVIAQADKRFEDGVNTRSVRTEKITLPSPFPEQIALSATSNCRR